MSQLSVKCCVLYISFDRILNMLVLSKGKGKH